MSDDSKKDIFVDYGNELNIQTSGLASTDIIGLFFKVVKYLKTDGELLDSDLDYKLKQVALSEKGKVSEFFRSVIDQSAFFSQDHKRFRKMLIDWYSANRTIITQGRNCKDPFTLSSEELNELIRSFGFPYPKKIISTTRKAQFVMDVVSLYQKKGTPEVFVKTLQTYFGLTNVILSEWWIHKKPGESNVFYAKSQPIYPRHMKDIAEMQLEIDLDFFVEGDPLWQITPAEIATAYTTSKITLPSITPYISVSGSFNVLNLNIALAILNRKLQESYECWQEKGTINRNMALSRIGGVYSILEVVLAMIYLFDSGKDTVDKKFLYYNDGRHEPLDKPWARDDEDDVEYGLIIDEFNNVNIRPKTRDERDEYLALRKHMFTANICNDVYDSTADVGGESTFNYDPGDGNENGEKTLTSIVRSAGDALGNINPDLKSELDTWLSAGDETDKRSLLESLLMDIEYYLMNTMEILDFPITYTILGVSLSESLREVINFFKPYRARLRDFVTTFTINDPLGDCFIPDDPKIFTGAKQIIVDKPYWSRFHNWDHGMVKDGGIEDMIIKQRLLSQFLMEDRIFWKIKQKIVQPVIMLERNVQKVNQLLEEKSPWGIWDEGLVRDYYKWTIPIMPKDYLFKDDLDGSKIRDEYILHVQAALQSELLDIENFVVSAVNDVLRERGPHGIDHGMVIDNAIVDDRWILPEFYRYILDDDFFKSKMPIWQKLENIVGMKDTRTTSGSNEVLRERGPHSIDNGMVNDFGFYTTDLRFNEILQRGVGGDHIDWGLRPFKVTGYTTDLGEDANFMKDKLTIEVIDL